MTAATVEFLLGGDTVTVPLEIDTDDVQTISGNVSGTFGDVHIAGNVNLTGDLIIEGRLTGVDTFTLEGNGFQLLVQHGGQLDLRGVEKTAWCPWGDTATGWQLGDFLAVAPTAPNVFVMSAVLWSGAWGTRPAFSPDVTLPDGQVVKPEVANLIRSITLKNLSRIHFHDDAGVQILKHVAVVDSGVTGVLAKYPLHFHLCGESVRGSLLEGVVVVNGKNHAFVVHGSHGVTLRDCVAHNTTNDAYWWDPPVAIPPAFQKDHTANNSNDIVYDHCLASRVNPVPGDNGFRLAAFVLGAGSGNTLTDSVATCVQGQSAVDASGFHWPESANQNVGGNQWVFENNTAHNNKVDGIFVWQNDSNPHVVDGFVGYRNGGTQIDHGAYDNNYDFVNMVLMGGTQGSFRLHAVGNVLLGNVIADTSLRIEKHNADAAVFAIVRNCQFPSVVYAETGLTHVSKIRYEDCGLTPSLFIMSAALPGSVAEIYEGGILKHRWTGGVWV